MATVFKRGGKKAKGNWYVQWYDHNGKRQSKCTQTTDKATAERIARKRDADAALRRDGVIDPTLDAINRESGRTIDSHLVDYESKLRAANCTDDHVNRTIGFIRKIASYTESKAPADFSADGVNRYAGKLRDKGRSARTIQAHLAAIKAFTKWLTEHHKLPRDPLASVKKPNPKADRRRERRMLLPDEWRLLETATEAGPERYGMTGGERVLLYSAAIYTGLRSSELRSLTRGRLYFDSETPYITCKAGSTKNRKDARQHIQPQLAASLKAHIATKAPMAPVFNLPHESRMARMLRDDLAEARTAWTNEARRNPQEYAQRKQSDFLVDTNHDGEILDFHSLRHTCGAWLSMSGVMPNVVQSVMRHSTITLTMDTYGHLFPGQDAFAVSQLGSMLSEPPEALWATGTDNLSAAVPKGAQQLAQQLGRETVRSTAKGCERKSEGTGQEETPKPLGIADLGDVLPLGATENESRLGGTRTPDPGIMSPLL